MGRLVLRLTITALVTCLLLGMMGQIIPGYGFFRSVENFAKGFVGGLFIGALVFYASEEVRVLKNRKRMKEWCKKQAEEQKKGSFPM